MEKNLEQKNRLSLGYRLFLSPEVGILIPVVIMCVVATIANPKFLVWGNLSYIIESGMYVGLLALGEAIIIMNGEIDLSIGAAGGFASVMVGVASALWGCPMLISLLIGLLAGVFIGFINGLVSAKFGLTSWIVTFATQFICLGVSAFISDGKVMKLMNEAFADQYAALGEFKGWTAPGLQFSSMFFVFILIMILLDIFVRKTQFGYKLRAVGGNRDAALLAGINVKNVKFIVFMIAGLFAGLYGVFFSVKQMSTNLAQGSGGEFRAITCCAIGGIAMTGGKGSIYGVGLGTLLFHIVNGALQSMGADNNVQLLMVGVLLVIAVLLDIIRQRVEARKMV